MLTALAATSLSASEFKKITDSIAAALKGTRITHLRQTFDFKATPYPNYELNQQRYTQERIQIKLNSTNRPGADTEMGVPLRFIHRTYSDFVQDLVDEQSTIGEIELSNVDLTDMICDTDGTSYYRLPDKLSVNVQRIKFETKNHVRKILRENKHVYLGGDDSEVVIDCDIYSANRAINTGTKMLVVLEIMLI